MIIYKIRRIKDGAFLNLRRSGWLATFGPIGETLNSIEIAKQRLSSYNSFRKYIHSAKAMESNECKAYYIGEVPQPKSYLDKLNREREMEHVKLITSMRQKCTKAEIVQFKLKEK